MSYGFASPTAFPETTFGFSIGYSQPGHGLLEVTGLAIEGEYLLPAGFIDTSLALSIYTQSLGQLSDHWGASLSASTLLIPAWGSTPPLALGLGAEVAYDANTALSISFGPTIGTDLLFTLDLPMIASVYGGPGYNTEHGFFLDWDASIRYYFEALDGIDVALELGSSHTFPLNIGLHMVFY